MNDPEFWQHVNIQGDDDCWFWQRGKTGAGYGAYYQPYRPRPIYAHRYAYWLTYGDFDGRAKVLHTCHNHACCNPRHLILNTDANAPRSQGGWKSGAKHHNASLTDKKVLRMRKLYAAGEHSQRELARMFKVSVSVVNDIVNRKTWVHI